jgi:hypothetical protein
MAGRRLGARMVALAGKPAKSTGNEALDSAISVGKGLVDSASELVPESVPRPVAKGGVAVAGGLVAFWLLQKVRRTWTLQRRPFAGA